MVTRITTHHPRKQKGRMADSIWDECFGESPAGGSNVREAPAAPAPAKRQKALDDLAAALAPFADADGNVVVVPPCPTPSTASAEYPIRELWHDEPPLFVGPIALKVYPDAGRGFAATRDIQPGEILMVEAPLIAWPGVERGALPLLSAVLRSNERERLLAALGRLHPESLDSVATDTLAALAEENEGTIGELLPLYREHVATARGDASDRLMLLRLCLAVRWNAFDSGLFLHEAIFNHAPARSANADKAAVLSALPSGVDGVVSVVRATRSISRGSQVLISYLQPAELSYASSCARLRQFDFGMERIPRHPEWDCPPRVGAGGAAGGLMGQAPTQTPGRDAGDAGGGGQAEEAREAAADLDAADAATRALEEEASTGIRLAMRRRDLSTGMEAADRAIECLVEQMGGRHLSVACARRELISALRRRLEARTLETATADDVPASESYAGAQPREAGRQSAGGDKGSGERSERGSEGDVRARALTCMLEHSLELWYTQRALLGPLHPDCAQTMHDISTALEALLSTASRSLTERFASLWGTPALASRAHGRAKQLHEGIATLYDPTRIVGALAHTASAKWP